MKITIIEGARGVGKSSITRALRDGLTNTVLINNTGNNEDSIEGKNDTFKYYIHLMHYLNINIVSSTPFNFLFDRIFFSEQVYSQLYKSYDFTTQFNLLLSWLDRLGKDVEVQVIFLVADKKHIARNLEREGKAHLFNDERYADSIHKSMEQMASYERLYTYSASHTTNIKYKRLDVSNLTLGEATRYVKSML